MGSPLANQLLQPHQSVAALLAGLAPVGFEKRLVLGIQRQQDGMVVMHGGCVRADLKRILNRDPFRLGRVAIADASIPLAVGQNGGLLRARRNSAKTQVPELW